MKFKDCKMFNKHKIRAEITERIFKYIKENIPSERVLNTFMLEDYVHLLIDETDYNPDGKYFYHEGTGIHISIDILEKVALDYVNDHFDEVTLMKI